MPAPDIYRTCGASAKTLLQAHVPAPNIYRTCGASACKHMCQRPIFTAFAVPAHASTCASAQYLPHLRCQRWQAHVPAPHIYRICGASACKHMSQRQIFTAFAVPAHASTCASAQYLPHLRCLALKRPEMERAHGVHCPVYEVLHDTM